MFLKNTQVDGTTRATPDLISILGARLILAALISFTILTALCIAENFLDESYLARWYAKTEISEIKDNISKDASGQIVFNRNAAADGFWAALPHDYAYRIWNEKGHIISSWNNKKIELWSPVKKTEGANLDQWQHKFSDQWLAVASGQRVNIDGQPIWIEVATSGDPLGRKYNAFYADFMHDVTRPLVPTLLAAIFLSLASLYWALKPVKQAILAVSKLQPSIEDPDIRIPIDGLPREVEALATTANNLLSRVGTLVRSQNEFIARAAHQLRTPLATMMLEVGHIKGSAARHIEADLERLSIMIDQLLEIAKIDGAPPDTSGVLSLYEIAADVEMDFITLAQSKHGTITIVQNGECSCLGDYFTIREAVSNLVSNAIVHHQGNPNVVIACGPGPRISVADDGPGIATEPTSTLFEPFVRGKTTADGSGLGLAFVKRVAELHKAKILLSRTHSGGTQFEIVLHAPGTKAQITMVKDSKLVEA